MKVLLVTNTSSLRCGVQLYGEQWRAALLRLGCEVDLWDGTYPAVRALGYLPADVDRYDIVHVNWDPQTINHYLPQHVADVADRLSLFLHDVPPHSTCPIQAAARWVWAFEPGAGITVLPHAVPPTPAHCPRPEIGMTTIGVSGVRDDPGAAEVRDLCRRHGWNFNAPRWWDGRDGWLSTEEEIRRLAASSVNVCWYHTTGRGKSMAALFCVAARRPLVLSPSSMFTTLDPYGPADAIYRARSWTQVELELLVELALTGYDYISPRPAQDLSWARVLAPVLHAWRGR